MSVYLAVTKFYITTKITRSVNHDGSWYVREDLPIGTVIALDADGNLYIPSSEYSGHMHRECVNGGVFKSSVHQLYRDNWMYAGTGVDQMLVYLAANQPLHRRTSPHDAALFNAGLEPIK
jgi:hypothetical protein